jgi:NADH dehydrogenase
MGRLRLTGFVAWILWCVAHIYFLIGFRNRFSVAFNWTWNYLTFQRGARLITGVTTLRVDAIAAAPAEVAAVTERVQSAA